MADANQRTDNIANDLFEQLLEFQWKGVSFPATTFSLILRHDLAQHKYSDRPGANIESTGRAPLQFDVSIPFLNGAIPGKGETWGILYPTQYRKFIAVATEGARGVLQHPEFGEVLCRLDHCRTTWSAERRDGVIVECSWLETLNEDTSDRSFALEPSPIASVLIGALDLDAQIQDVNPPFPKLPEYQPDFAAFMRQITGFTDQVALLAQSNAGKIDSIQYRLDALQNSFEKIRTPKTPTTVKETVSPDKTGAARACLAWPMRNTVENMRSALFDLRQILGTSGSSVKLYFVPIDMSLAAVAQNVGASVTDVIKLNPNACGSPIVPAFSTIRYYAKAA